MLNKNNKDNVEKKLESIGDNAATKTLMKLAKDEKDLEFDVESGITEYIIRDYLKERKPNQTFQEWSDSKPREYFLNIPLELKEGGVVSITEYLKQREKPKIKRLDLDSAAPGKAISQLSEAEREVVNNLLRMTLDNLRKD